MDKKQFNCSAKKILLLYFIIWFISTTYFHQVLHVHVLVCLSICSFTFYFLQISCQCFETSHLFFNFSITIIEMKMFLMWLVFRIKKALFYCELLWIIFFKISLILFYSTNRFKNIIYKHCCISQLIHIFPM